ncbi:MAG: hypothetical protein WBD87_04420 [Candidatus Acidiferrales bacterium]
MKNILRVLVAAFLIAAGFVAGKEKSTITVHADSPETGRYSLFRTDADTNFYDRGVFFLDSSTGAVYRYDWDRKELIEVPKIGADTK